MKTRLSILLLALAFLFLSCGSSLSQGGEGYVTVDIYEVVQKLASRSAGDGQTATVTLRTEGDFVTSVTETVSTSGGSIKLDNLPIGKTITVALETTIGHKYFEGASAPIRIQEGNNQVTIRLAKTGISTDYVLYDYYELDSDQQGYRFYLSESTHTIPGTPALINNDEYQNSFCFDNDGNLYAFKEEAGDIYLMSTRSDFTPSSTGRAPGSKLYLAMDREKDILWLLADQELSLYGYKNISRQTTLDNYPSDLRSAYVSSNYFYTDAEAQYEPKNFTAHDGYLYFVGREYDEINNMYNLHITKTDVVSDVEDYEGNIILSCHNTRNLNITISPNTIVSDMLYQDGAVFILLREFGSGNNLSMSRGAIIKYDENSGSVTSNGFAPETTLTSFKAVCTDGTNPLYKDNGHNEYFTSNFEAESGASYKLRANWNGLSDAFVGPEKFIAIKPKKLVISDTGYAFYTNSDGLLAKKHINRVVEVDLKDLSIETTTVLDCKFNTEDLDTAFASGFRTNTTGQSCYKRSGSAYENLAFPMFLEEE